MVDPEDEGKALCVHSDEVKLVSEVNLAVHPARLYGAPTHVGQPGLTKRGA